MYKKCAQVLYKSVEALGQTIHSMHSKVFVRTKSSRGARYNFRTYADLYATHTPALPTAKVTIRPKTKPELSTLST
jgi:hypothetical protein